jgi:hypothetical protein
MAQSSAEPSARWALCGPETRINEALTDMHAYRLLLEGDWERLGRQLDELALAGGSPDECSALFARRAEIGEELEAFRQTTAALREDTIGPPADAQS